MTLAQKTGIPIPTHHLTSSAEYAVFEICCKECKQMLTAVVGKTGLRIDLVWPLRVICGEGHKLVKRGAQEDASVVVISHGASQAQALGYLLSFSKGSIVWNKRH